MEFNVIINIRWYCMPIYYLVLAPAINCSKPAGTGGSGMQWAAVRTNLGVRRVPPQINLPPFSNKICHGFEWAGASIPPPTIRSSSLKNVSLLIIKHLDFKLLLHTSLKLLLILVFHNNVYNIKLFSAIKFIKSVTQRKSDKILSPMHFMSFHLGPF